MPNAGGRAQARDRKATRGFTLVEVLTAVTVLALVMGPLASAAVLFLQHGGDAGRYLADDGTVRAAAALFVGDVQSADTVTAPDPSPCGSTGAALVTTATDDTGTVYRTSWFAEPAADATALVRRRCTGTSLLSTVVLGDLATAPGVVCSPSCDAPAALTLSGTTVFGSPFTVSAHRRPA